MQCARDYVILVKLYLLSSTKAVKMVFAALPELTHLRPPLVERCDMHIIQVAIAHTLHGFA